VVARAAAALLAHLSDSVEEEQAERVALAQRSSAVPQVEHCPDLVVLNDIDELSDPETPERPGLAALLRRAVQSAAAVAGISSSSETGAERTAGVCELCRGRVVGLAYCPQCRGSGSAPLAPR
jgi:hypothetical protein